MREPSSFVWMRSRVGPLLLVLFVVASGASAQTSFYDFENPPLAPVGGLTEVNGILYGTNGGGRDGGSLFRLDPTDPYAWEEEMSSLDWGWDPHGGLLSSGGFLYGTTRYGGQWGNGTIFRIDLANSYPYVETIASFHTEGEGPYGGLVAVGSYLYGVTREGGDNGLGTIYRFDPATQTITTLHSFNGADGVYPEGGLVAAGLVLYGTTPVGGTSDLGTVFRLNLSTSPATFTTLASFDNATLPGSGPNGDLVANGTTLFGTTRTGGTAAAGTIFKVNISTATVTNVLSLAGTDGQNPEAGLLLSGGMLYGTARNGGTYSHGTLFELSPSSTSFSRVTPFRGSPVWVEAPDSRLVACGPYLYGMASAGWSGGGQLYRFDPAAGTIEDVYDNYPSDGFTPTGHVAIVGNFMYGTTDQGPWSGSVFRIDMTQIDPYYGVTFEPFSYTNGADPDGLRLIGSDLYGVTRSGGDYNCGTIYKVDQTTLAITRVASLDPSIACEAQGTLTQRGSFLYGTARSGGTNGAGSVFKVNATTGAVSLVAAFDGSIGTEPSGTLAPIGTDLFGVLSGYPWTIGSVFKVDASDNLTLTAIVDCNSPLGDGRQPIGDLVAVGGYLYGTAYDDCYADGGGTIFRVDPSSGEVTTQFAFDTPNVWSETTPGSRPQGGLTLQDGFLYGTTTSGARRGRGAFFKFDPATQQVTTLWSFADWYLYPPMGWDARNPLTSSGGYLYGVTSQGGRGAGGMAFSSNASPGFSRAASLSVTAGSPASMRTLGTVFDLEEPAGSLTVTLPYPATGITNGPPTNSSGTITASLAAQCTATPGLHYLSVRVADSAFGRYYDSAEVTVVANPSPTIGTYPNLSVNAGQSTTFTPSAAPTDNGSVTLAVVKPAGYTGTATINAVGVVSIGSPNAGMHTFTVNVTDNCTTVTSRTFTLTANEPFGAPQAFSAIASGATSVTLAWSPVASATRYDIFRNNVLLTSTTTPGYVDNTAAANSAYFYKVRAAANSILSPFSLPDAATTVAFENDPLSSGMLIAAPHLTQLRTAVNALRVAAGLTAATFVDNPLGANAAVDADHVTQLRDALNAARTAVGLAPLTFTDSLAAGSTHVRAIHFEELRSGVK